MMLIASDNHTKSCNDGFERMEIFVDVDYTSNSVHLSNTGKGVPTRYQQGDDVPVVAVKGFETSISHVFFFFFFSLDGLA